MILFVFQLDISGIFNKEWQSKNTPFNSVNLIVFNDHLPISGKIDKI